MNGSPLIFCVRVIILALVISTIGTSNLVAEQSKPPAISTTDIEKLKAAARQSYVASCRAQNAHMTNTRLEEVSAEQIDSYCGCVIDSIHRSMSDKEIVAGGDRSVLPLQTSMALQNLFSNNFEMSCRMIFVDHEEFTAEDKKVLADEKIRQARRKARIKARRDKAT